jgi:hypothetical protein
MKKPLTSGGAAALTELATGVSAARQEGGRCGHA